MTTETFRVPEMSCQHCVNAITKEVTAVPGVQKVEITLNDKLVKVQHDQQADTSAIVAAINEAGYDEVARVN